MAHPLTDHWLSDGVVNAQGQGAPYPPGLEPASHSMVWGDRGGAASSARGPYISLNLCNIPWSFTGEECVTSNPGWQSWVLLSSSTHPPTPTPNSGPGLTGWQSLDLVLLQGQPLPHLVHRYLQGPFPSLGQLHPPLPWWKPGAKGERWQVPGSEQGRLCRLGEPPPDCLPTPEDGSEATCEPTIKLFIVFVSSQRWIILSSSSRKHFATRLRDN